MNNTEKLLLNLLKIREPVQLTGMPSFFSADDLARPVRSSEQHPVRAEIPGRNGFAMKRATLS